jgi:HAD superfamily hydrolase (TIGR01549 family)
MALFNLNKYKTILIDFDGVIANTNIIKGSNIFNAAQTFVCLEDAENFRKYFTANNGVPRELKASEFFKNPELEDKVLALYNKLNTNLLNAELAPGLVDFLKKTNDLDLVVLSGGDFNEVTSYLSFHKLLEFFSSVLCGPKTKNENLNSLNLNNQALFIGDSLHDYEVAVHNNLDFIFMYGWSQDEYINNTISKDLTMIRDFVELMEKL